MRRHAPRLSTPTTTSGRGSFAVPAGSWEYKAALNDAWTRTTARTRRRTARTSRSTLARGRRRSSSTTTTRPTGSPSNRNSVIATRARQLPVRARLPRRLAARLPALVAAGPRRRRHLHVRRRRHPAGRLRVQGRARRGWDENYGAGGAPTARTSRSPSRTPATRSRSPTTPPPTSVDDRRRGRRHAGARRRRRARPARASASDLTDEVFYFVLPDRFDERRSTRERHRAASTGGQAHAPASTRPTRASTTAATSRACSTGSTTSRTSASTAIWMAPMFKNQPVQGTGARRLGRATTATGSPTSPSSTRTSAPTRSSRALVDARARPRDQGLLRHHHQPHGGRDRLREGNVRLRQQGRRPRTVDADGARVRRPRLRRHRRHVPARSNLESFPYTRSSRPRPTRPSRRRPGSTTRLIYHNRGNSTFAGENSHYGDFFGLDDLFTEQPEVVDGMIDIYESGSPTSASTASGSTPPSTSTWSSGRRSAPALLQHAASAGNDDFFMFGEVFDSNPSFMSPLHDRGRAPGDARLRLPGSRPDFAASGVADRRARGDFFARTTGTPTPTRTPTACRRSSATTTWAGSATSSRTDQPGRDDAELLARDELAHALMYLVRGMPVVYYGDEQGFTGDGGDKDARQDMFASQVGSYNDDDLIGTDATTADANFDPTHPLYPSLAELAELRADHPRSATARRSIATRPAAPGIYAFSPDRPRRADRVRRRAQQQRDAADAGPDLLARRRLHGSGRRRRGG